jgi:hypothetical protein
MNVEKIKKNRVELKIEQIQAIIEYRQKYPNKKQTELCEYFGKLFKVKIPPTTMSGILSVAIISNADGSEKIKPIVIGKFAKPRSFGKWNPNSIVSYYYNSTAWMTMEIFEKWLKDFNNKTNFPSLYIGKKGDPKTILNNDLYAITRYVITKLLCIKM